MSAITGRYQIYAARIDGAEVARYRGGSRIRKAVGRKGGPNVSRIRPKCVWARRRDERNDAAEESASCEGTDEENVLEKYKREASSIGWKRTRATNEPRQVSADL